MEYKGYIGKVDFDYDSKIFTGEVINTRAVITFQGSTVDELETSFRDSVNDYLDWCAQDGVSPEKPYSGKFNVRITPALHQRISAASKEMNISMNSFIEKSLWDELALAEKENEYKTK